MTGITNFFGNGTIKFGKVMIEETSLFDLEDSFEGWPGTYEFSSGVLSSPNLGDSFEGWPGTYEFSSGILSSPDLEDSFESAEGWDTI